ncbi:hypothetical protein AMQ84_27275 [Paenibacillus riograndensis]|uniref:Uncharacterized protein n=1 Tax=Paenibacillus riograndensis TaxID=483937 RepID=A0A132TKP0_9BACL|nr:hypothetical protein [Paenibacillus riograndensis]KWX71626.1 hypothetical protein AMQ84_27275 [Paenibacillus riograndensis]
MPVPDMNGAPPWADFEDIKNKLNELVGKYNNLLVNLDSLNVVSLTADHIDAGTIDANVVTIRSDLTAGAYVQIDGNGMVINDGSMNTFRADITGHVTMTGATIVNNLSSGAYTNISDNGITINDGTMDTFRADITGKVTMTGAMIRSATGYPRVVMDPNDKLFAAELNATESIAIQSNYFGAPSLNLTHSGVVVGRMNMVFGYPELYGSGGIDLLTDNNGDIKLTAGGTGQVILNYADFSKFQNNTETLQDALDSKANYGVSTSLSGSHNHGISPGTQLAVFGGGFVTWVGASDHSHAQN